MRVLHLLSSTGYHGAENMAAELIRQLAAQGVSNHLGVFRSSEHSNLDVLEITRPCLENGVVFDCRGRFDLRTVIALRDYLKSNAIDVIHSHKYKTNLYAYLANLGLGKKLVSTCHNWLGQSLTMRFYAWLDKRLLKGFDMVVGVSGAIVAEIVRYLPSKRVLRIGNGIDVEKYRRSLTREEARRRLQIDNRHVIGFVGRLSPEKGVEYLLRALAGLVSDGFDVCALIVGDGTQAASLRAEAQALQIADRVIFTGNREDTPMLYAAMDVFVLPSLQEAFPMVIIEAMACGVPVVATRVGDVAEIVVPGVSGLVVDTQDATALNAAIREVLTHGDAVERMSAAARARAEEKFSSVAMAADYRSLYERVMRAQ